MARELHRWPSPWRPILKPCQFAIKDVPRDQFLFPGYGRRATAQ